MSLLCGRHSLLTGHTTETFQGMAQGKNLEIGENWEMGLGAPIGPPGGPGGIRMGPHPRFAPFQTGSTPPPPMTPPIRPNPIFRKTEKVPPPVSVKKPTFQKLSVQGSTHLWGVPRSIRTDTESSIACGCQKCLSKPISFFWKSHFSVPNFPNQAQPAPGRSPTQKFPCWAGYAYSV